MREKKQKKYLITGLFLVVLFWLFYFFNVIEINRDVVPLHLSSRYSLIVFIAFIGLIGPSIEEIGFRLFIGTKNKFQIFISIAVLSIYIFLQHNILIFAICISAIAFSVWLYLKDFRFSIDAQILITSIIFSTLHFDESTVSTNTLSSILYFSYFIGIGFILSWIRINYSIFFSILLHVLFNSSIVIFMMSKGFYSTSKIIDCNESQFNFRKKNVFDSQTQKSIFKGDTLVIQNSNLIYMLDLYMPDEDVKGKYTQNNPLIYYDLEIPDYYKKSPPEILKCLEENKIISKIKTRL